MFIKISQPLFYRISIEFLRWRLSFGDLAGPMTIMHGISLEGLRCLIWKGNNGAYGSAIYEEPLYCEPLDQRYVSGCGISTGEKNKP